jgi:hypothetical protein
MKFINPKTSLSKTPTLLQPPFLVPAPSNLPRHRQHRPGRVIRPVVVHRRDDDERADFVQEEDHEQSFTLSSANNDDNDADRRKSSRMNVDVTDFIPQCRITSRQRHGRALGRSPRRTRRSRHTLDPPPRRRQHQSGGGGCVRRLPSNLSIAASLGALTSLSYEVLVHAGDVSRGIGGRLGAPVFLTVSVTVWHRGVEIAWRTRRARRSLMGRGLVVGDGAMRLLNCV